MVYVKKYHLKYGKQYLPVVVQNINNPSEKVRLEHVNNLDTPQNFQPIQQLEHDGVLYFYYDKSFTVKEIAPNYYTIHPGKQQKQKTPEQRIIGRQKR